MLPDFAPSEIVRRLTTTRSTSPAYRTMKPRAVVGRVETNAELKRVLVLGRNDEDDEVKTLDDLHRIDAPSIVVE